jgi:hypothetical protein
MGLDVRVAWAAIALMTVYLLLIACSPRHDWEPLATYEDSEAGRIDKEGRP